MGLDLSTKTRAPKIKSTDNIWQTWETHLGHFGALISALDPSPNYMSHRFAGQILLFSFRRLFSQAFFNFAILVKIQVENIYQSFLVIDVTDSM